MQVEELFQAAQAKKLVAKQAATKQLAILDVKRATGIGIRMSGLRSPSSTAFSPCNPAQIPLDTASIIFKRKARERRRGTGGSERWRGSSGNCHAVMRPKPELYACRVPWRQAAEAVKQLDTRVLCGADDARAMLACVPTAEERKMFGAFLRSGGDAAALSDAERFCLELMQVQILEVKETLPLCTIAGCVLSFLLPQSVGCFRCLL